MKRDAITDAEVEIEIARLNATEEVKLAQKEIRIKNRRRCYMAQLRSLEKRGKQLKKMGVTTENMESVLFGEPFEDQTDVRYGYATECRKDSLFAC